MHQVQKPIAAPSAGLCRLSKQAEPTKAHAVQFIRYTPPLPLLLATLHSSYLDTLEPYKLASLAAFKGTKFTIRGITIANTRGISTLRSIAQIHPIRPRCIPISQKIVGILLTWRCNTPERILIPHSLHLSALSQISKLFHFVIQNGSHYQRRI